MNIHAIMTAPAGLSPSDKALISLLALNCPPGGTAVEVGTGFGGSSFIMRQARPDLTIHSLDVRVWPGVPERLDPIGIKRFLGDAGAFTAACPDEADLLFIDGDHSFTGVRKDFETLAPRLKPGGAIAFHDHAMFAVRLLCDTLQDTGALVDVCGAHNFLVGKLAPGFRPPDAGDYARTLSRLVHAEIHGGAPPAVTPDPWPQRPYLGDFDDLADTRLVGKGCCGWFIKEFFDLPRELFIDSGQAENPGLRHIVLSSFVSEIITNLHVRKQVPSDHILVFPQYRLTQLFLDDLARGGERLLRIAADAVEAEIIRQALLPLDAPTRLALAGTGLPAAFLRGFWYFRWHTVFGA
jgi:precorrin-6B methylase 2